MTTFKTIHPENRSELAQGDLDAIQKDIVMYLNDLSDDCLLYTSPSPRDVEESRMPSSA